MSNFRRSQNQSNPNKLNAILSTVIFILILNVTIQIWLLYAALNNALDNNKEILIPAFVASFVLFLVDDKVIIVGSCCYSWWHS